MMMISDNILIDIFFFVIRLIDSIFFIRLIDTIENNDDEEGFFYSEMKEKN